MSVQLADGRANGYIGTAAEILALTSVVVGTRGYATDTKVPYVYDGATWVVDTRGGGPLAPVFAQTPTAYRSAVTAADLMAAVGTVTLSDINAVGVFANSAHNVKVVAINAYGRTTPSTIQSITPTLNHQVKIAFAQVTGATGYDIYISTDSDPKWLARITEAQRATGCLITAVGTVGAGGAAGSAYAALVGTGLQAATTAAQNHAYAMPADAAVNAAGYQFVDFDLTFSRTGDAVASSLIVVPAFYNSRTATYELGEIQYISFGGLSGVYNANKQRLRVEARGCPAVHLLVASIAGTGASLDIDAVLS